MKSGYMFCLGEKIGHFDLAVSTKTLLQFWKLKGTKHLISQDIL